MDRKVFKESARTQIRKVRSGESRALSGGRKSVAASQAARAAAGGPLPASMYKAAREGRLVKRG